jgi:hypothetical protein
MIRTAWEWVRGGHKLEAAAVLVIVIMIAVGSVKILVAWHDARVIDQFETKQDAETARRSLEPERTANAKRPHAMSWRSAERKSFPMFRAPPKWKPPKAWLALLALLVALSLTSCAANRFVPPDSSRTATEAYPSIAEGAAPCPKTFLHSTP